MVVIVGHPRSGDRRRPAITRLVASADNDHHPQRPPPTEGRFVGIVIGFIPWIVYWILVGNVPFTTAVTIAFAITLLITVLMRVREQRIGSLDIGNLVVFTGLALAAFLVPDDVLERWLQPLSSLGLFLIALVGLLIGRPFVRDYAVASVDAVTAKTQGFKTITTAMTWMWVGAFGLMFAFAMIPPIVDGDATMLDMDDTLSIV
jgi:hypothetical protein